MQSLIESPERQRPSSFRLFAAPTAPTRMQQAWQLAFSSGRSLLVARIHISSREGRADSKSYEGIVHRVRNRRNRRLYRIREEVRERKSIRSVTADGGGLASGGCGRKGRRDAVEAQVDPGGEEAVPREEHGGVGAECDAGDCVCEDEDGGEVLDADAKDAAEDGDGVFGDELFEGDEEGGLDGYAAAYGGCAAEVSVLEQNLDM